MRSIKPFEPLAIGSARRLFDEVHARLRSAIITGHLEPGSRVIERNLTSSLQVSRTPVREALKRLEQEGLIVSYPHRGSFVRCPSLDEARQVYEVRRSAEGLSGQLAAERATEEELAVIRDIVHRAAHALEDGDREAALLLNSDLHEAQVRAAHNTFLVDQLRSLWAYVNLLRGRSWTATERVFQAHREHEAILVALERRDAVSARRLNEEHVEQAWKDVEARFSQPGANDGPAVAAQAV